MFDKGHRVGPYEVIAHLSDGGMGSLFLARRIGAAGFSKPVALKVIHPHLATDPGFKQAFVNEARLAAQVAHPNVVHIEELSESDDSYFLAMEYVNGFSLADFMETLSGRGLQLAPACAVAITAQIAEGLHAAHETHDESGRPLGIVHRDISPQNVLLSFTGFVKVIDFGIASARGDDSAVGPIQGKARYMAPEQAAGGDLDRRCDVYALGILLWEMLTLSRMRQAPTSEALLEEARNPKVTAPSTRASAVSDALDRVTLQALAIDPSRRPPTAQAFRTALLSAEPEAVAVDATRLSALFREIMGKEVVEERRQQPDLPAELTAQLEPASDEDAAKTLTIMVAPPPAATPSRRAPLMMLGLMVALLIGLGLVATLRGSPPPPPPRTVEAPPTIAPPPPTEVTPPAEVVKVEAEPAPPPPRKRVRRRRVKRATRATVEATQPEKPPPPKSGDPFIAEPDF